MFKQLERDLLKSDVLTEVDYEMSRQVAKWGVQDHKSSTSPNLLTANISAKNIDADFARNVCDMKHDIGYMSWLDIFLEEVFEATDEAQEGNLEKLREELIQVAAVALSWVMSIDRNAH